MTPEIPPISNLHVRRADPLVTPRALKEELPVTTEVARTVVTARSRVRAVIRGEDPRLLVIVGPCSIHDPGAAMEYAARLGELRSRVEDALTVVMRVYFEKPRTSTGWKGLINDPRLDGSCDIESGLRLARRLLLDVNALGLPAATEFLDPVIPQYFADLVSWAAIGARTTESQTHREMASGLSMPVGFKNGTDGTLDGALNAMLSAGSAHNFLGVDEDGRSAIIQSTGNPDLHVVLRGGGGRTNYDAAFVEQSAGRLRAAGLNHRLMVDCGHANANRDHLRQAAVLEELHGQLRKPSRAIIGVMLESNLHAGSQKLGDPARLVHGVSITDPCIDWETTAALLEETAAVMRSAQPAR